MARVVTGEARTIMVTKLGAQGDGLAGNETPPFFVPFALPGEDVRVAVSGGRAELVEVVTRSADRIAPVCRHFGICGGCVAQHMAPGLYGSWKRDLVVAALGARGIVATVDDLVVPSGRRRRATMTARLIDHVVILGYHQASSHDLVDIAECPVLDARIVAALPKLKLLIAPLLPKHEAVRVSVTSLPAGIDVALDGVNRKLNAEVRARIARDATAMHLARVSIEGDVVFEALPAKIIFGTVEVALPPGLFIQAMADAEAEMAQRCVAAIGKAKSVADLFSGAGALTFPIARQAKVAAYDGEASAIAVLNAAVRYATGIKPVTGVVRDLIREPLSATELNAFDAIVFDPPRAGAEAQARMIARSKVKTVVAVSCNPATLARDAKTLTDGGYSIESITPIDQFHFAPHVEVVVVFRKLAAR